MTEFDETLWSEREYAQEYRDHADHYIQERDMLFKVLVSFYRQFIGIGQAKRMLDLGCGDGAIANQILRVDDSVNLTLMDGSKDMLDAARLRFWQFPKLQYVLATFEALIGRENSLPTFDFIASAFAIHHLSWSSKIGLFEQIYAYLNEGGAFLNIDTVFPNNPSYTDWYYEFWREWIIDRQTRLELKEAFDHVPNRARTNPENKLDPLQNQLDALTRIGFKDVECHYKLGIFAIFGGRK
ncbi:MAG: class I SAM-dependent methyltransferase [Anaerolineae bacterium]|nr:class I SAM-dependent methyltransferase [Anaerolineae bacterium]